MLGAHDCKGIDPVEPCHNVLVPEELWMVITRS